MTKNKNLFKNISIFLCLVPTLVLSLFCLVPKNEIQNVAAADDVVTNFSFIGSNIFVPVTLTHGSSYFDRNAFACLSYTFSFHNSMYAFGISGFVNNGDIGSTSASAGELIPLSYDNFGLSYSGFMAISSASSYGFDYTVNRYGNITRNIDRVKFSSSSDGGCCYNTVTYYDNLDNYISFTTEVWYNDNSFATVFAFDTRTYYINLDNISNNTYYEAGYTDGYNAGVSDGNSSGYQDGYSAGQTIGYGNGYNDGLEQSGKYSFNSLMGAVINAPVSAFTSLLNFEVLGFNILGFITGLLTLALIVFIIKLCLGGK